jgi:hypothetical protein
MIEQDEKIITKQLPTALTQRMGYIFFKSLMLNFELFLKLQKVKSLMLNFELGNNLKYCPIFSTRNIFELEKSNEDRKNIKKSNARDEMQRSCHIHCAGSTARSGGNRANVSSRAFSGRASRAENG